MTVSSPEVLLDNKQFNEKQISMVLVLLAEIITDQYILISNWI
ncbi:4581_t:CDS:2 [Racocetra fulgida]|uniref:4581_t:CDS:1 n=1 Tax=Racocetra fulgida TaxID=60492 RepID=A0A9N9AG47_9GLOM|nr:4581_t:CDS:2 [Racocetra fulgida]